MQLLLDFLPIIAFFVTYKVTGNNIFAATGVIIVAVLVQTVIQWVRHRKVSPVALISAAMVLVFGGLTLLVHDKTFIQWKVTAVYWLFGAAFLASHFFGEKPMVERLMGEHLTLERGHWRRLSWAWIVFFALLGATNLYVAYNYSEAAWVNFKLFGTLGLMLLFMVAQGFWIASKLPADPARRAE
jgi:intracellular septation protein